LETSKNYLGNLNSVEKIICGHSYFTTSPTKELISKRQELSAKIQQQKINYWQSEYCVLGDNAGEIEGGGQDLSMKTALYVAKVIHADLVYANASAWHWWLSVSANDYKDGLIYVSNNGVKDENDSNKFDGEVYESKLLWALGNFSRFIRPQMQRIKVEIENQNLMVSAYKNAKQMVIVLVNASQNQQIELPSSMKNSKVDAYITSKDKNLTHTQLRDAKVEIPAESVVTLVLSL
jgi:hypothetical protein